MDIALTEQNDKIIKLLLSKGHIHINDQNKDGDTLLHSIIKYHHSKRYYNMNRDFILANKDVDVNIQNNDGNTALHLGLIYEYDSTIVDLLKYKNINIYLSNKNNLTPLDIAMKKYGDNIDSSLLLDTSKQDRFGNTALHLAAKKNNNDKLLRFILLNNKNINNINLKNNRGETALHVAISNGNMYIAYLLLEQENIDVNIQNNDGNTVLHMAFKKGYKDYKNICDDILAMSNSNLNLQNNDGETPFHIALKKRSKIDVIEYILKNKNIDINLQDKSGNAALHLLALEYFYNDARKLIDSFLSYNNINLNLKNIKNKTAFDLANDVNNFTISDSLRQFSKSHKQ